MANIGSIHNALLDKKLKDPKQYMKKNNSSIIQQYIKCKYLFILLIPVLIWYLVFSYGPLYGIQLAFKDYKLALGIWNSPWVGLQHFTRMFTASTDFPRIMRNTLTISVYQIIFGFPAPIILALLLNEVRSNAFKRISQTITYLPHFLSWVVLYGILAMLLSPSDGPVNFIIKGLGFKPIYFLGDKSYFRFTLVITAIWKEIGWGSIVYLASLSMIDTQMYEAAVIDGASRFKQMIYITLPGLFPTIAFMFTLRMGSVLDAGMDQILNLYNPAVYEVSDILDTYVFRVGLQQAQYSFATAVGLFKNVIAFILVLVTNNIVKKMGQESIF